MKKKGFTLIEVIVVIVILAILMAVAVPSVMSYMKEGQESKYLAASRGCSQRINVELSKFQAGSSDAKNYLAAAKIAIRAYNNSATGDIYVVAGKIVFKGTNQISIPNLNTTASDSNSTGTNPDFSPENITSMTLFIAKHKTDTRSQAIGYTTIIPNKSITYSPMR